MGLLVLCAILVLANTNARYDYVSPHLDVLLALDLSTSTVLISGEKVLVFIDRLCYQLNQRGELRIVFMVQTTVVSPYPYNESACNVDSKSREAVEKYLASFFSLTKDRNYGGLFDAAAIKLQRTAKENNKQVLILITDNRETCKVPRCLDTKGCCTRCSGCKTTSCDKMVAINRTQQRKVKLFVTHEAEDLKNSGVTIITIGIYSDTEFSRLQCWASPNSAIALDHYDDLPVKGSNRVSKLLDTIITTSSPKYAVSSTSVESDSTISVNSSDSRKGTGRAILPLWITVAIVVGFSATALLLIVVIAMLVRQRIKTTATTASRPDGDTLHREPSNKMFVSKEAAEYTGIRTQLSPGHALPSSSEVAFTLSTPSQSKTLIAGQTGYVNQTKQFVGSVQPEGLVSSKEQITIKGSQWVPLTETVTEEHLYDTVKTVNTVT